MHKILIIRFSSIGDIVLTTPIIRCAKKQITDSQVHVLVKKGFEKVLIGNPYIDKIHILDGDVKQTILAIINEGFDIVIDLQKNLKSRRIAFKIGKPTYTFDKLNIKKWLLTALKINLLPSCHIVDRYFEGVKGLGLSNDGQGLDFYFSQEDTAHAARLLTSDPYQVLILGATHYTKRIPDSLCQQIIQNSPINTVLVGGPDVAELAQKLHAQFGSQTIDLCGKLSLQQSAAVISRCYKVITADTGMMHIAAALDSQIHVLWGNTVPAFGMYPYLKSSSKGSYISHEVHGLACRPCSKLGSTKCPKGHHNCMMKQDVNSIFVQ
jgi:ADP-heptose:LPS heptosyltransferase